jgi:hypothetical protein
MAESTTDPPHQYLHKPLRKQRPDPRAAKKRVDEEPKTYGTGP